MLPWWRAADGPATNQTWPVTRANAVGAGPALRRTAVTAGFAESSRLIDPSKPAYPYGAIARRDTRWRATDLLHGCHSVGGRVDARHGSIAGVRDPDGTAANGQRDRPRTDRNRRRQRHARGRVEVDHQAAVLGGHPDAVLPNDQRDRRRPDADRLARVAARRVEPDDRPVAGVGNPDRITAGGYRGGAFPTVMVWTTRLVAALMRETVRSPLLATQIEPLAPAMPVGALPTSMVSTTARVWGSIRETVPSPVLVTHTASSA